MLVSVSLWSKFLYASAHFSKIISVKFSKAFCTAHLLGLHSSLGIRDELRFFSFPELYKGIHFVTKDCLIWFCDKNPQIFVDFCFVNTVMYQTMQILLPIPACMIMIITCCMCIHYLSTCHLHKI